MLAAAPTLADVCIELAQGFESAMQELDRLQPPGVRILLCGLPLGRIPAQAGAEHVRGIHLRAWLMGEGALCYANARALLAALGVDPCTSVFVLSGRRQDVTSLRRSLRRAQTLSPEEQADRLQPSAVTELELANGLRGVQFLAGSLDRQQVLVRWRGRPLGWLHLVAQSEPRTAGDILYALLVQVGDELLVDPALLSPASMPPAVPGQGKHEGAAPALSIVVCTRDRPQNLEGCLQALSQLRPLPHNAAVEIIVVDNASVLSRTAEIAAAFGVRYVREDRPGLDFARNCGLAVARAPIVAYVDDDARPAEDWAEVLAAAFEQKGVAAITGYVAPAELSSRAQCLFEWVYGGMGHGLRRKYYRRDLLSSSEFLQASACGVGANMAFRRQVLIELGGFDEALDVGGPARGGGDVEMFHRLIANGCSLVYEPAVLVWHYHRRDMEGLRRQLNDNGRSFGAYLLTCATNRTVARGELLSFVAIDWVGGWLLRRLAVPGPLPRSLVWAELRGALYSPIAYRRAVQRIKAMKS
jgi:glycosyltransferase involved in cell wall biosynthesis